MRILVTGATGYVGGRLVPRLLEAGHEVAVLLREPRRLNGRAWSDQVRVIEGDLVDGQGPWITEVREGGFAAAYYLVHSLAAGEPFSDLDRRAATHFCLAARNIPHTIYLGGLQPKEEKPSAHLASRAETGVVLRKLLPVTEFRAGPIVGSGSASFEMIRYLAERLPVMIVPLKINNLVQPIGIRSTLNYLIAALEVPPAGVVEIGAPPVTFKEMILEVAELRGISRKMFPVPFLSPAVAARWVGLVTPLTAEVARPLIEGVSSPLPADTTRAEALFPEVRPNPYREAVRLALWRIDSHQVETRWSGTSSRAEGVSLEDWEGMICEERVVHVDAPPEVVYRVFTGLGGETGWLVWNWAWSLRGVLDQLIGGPGLRRGRRDVARLYTGEAIDFWRVEHLEQDREILLRAEMKVPGRAWLRWRAEPMEEGGSCLTQQALFRPRGLAGALYWYALYVVHGMIFSDLANALKERSEQAARNPSEVTVSDTEPMSV